MYLHIGAGKTVRQSDIIGIFDLDAVTVTRTGKEFLATAEARKQVTYADDDVPRSFLLTEEGGESHVYLSRISSGGLAGRTQKAVFADEETFTYEKRQQPER